MMEGSPNPEEQKGKFNSPRDELLYKISVDGWACQSSGDVASPTGWYARISNPPEEMAELRDAMAEDYDSPAPEAIDGIQGHFTLRENSEGFVSVQAHPTEEAAQAAYDGLEVEYGEWLGGQV